MANSEKVGKGRKKPESARKIACPSRAAAADRRRKFVDACVANGLRGPEAAIEAGFAPHSAAQRSSEMLADPKIRAEIEEKLRSLAPKLELTAARTLQEIARLAYTDPRKFYNEDGSLKPVHQLDDDAAATVASVEVDEIKIAGAVIGTTRKIKQWDKARALDMAARIHGLYEKDNEQAAPQVRIVVVPAKGAA